MVIRLRQGSSSRLEVTSPVAQLLLSHLFSSAHIFSLGELLPYQNQLFHQLSVLSVVILLYFLSIDLLDLKLDVLLRGEYGRYLEVFLLESQCVFSALDLLGEALDGLLRTTSNLLLHLRPHIY